MRPAPLPLPLAAALFSVHDAAPIVGAERLRRHDLETPTRGARAPAGTGLTPAAVAPILRPGQRFSHATAVLLWHLPVPFRVLAGPLHVTTEGDGPVMRRRGIVGHRSHVALTHTVEGLPVSSPAEAFVECASILTFDEMIQLGDAIAGPTGTDGILLLREAVARRSGSRHVRRLRAVLDSVRENVESPKETQLRLLIIRAGFPEPALNEPVLDSNGRSIGRPDLSYPSIRLGIEYEGDHHRTDREQWQEDIRRRERFAAHGWRTLRVTQIDLTDHSDEFLGRLHHALGLR